MKTASEKCVRQGGEGRGPGEGRSSIRKPQGRHHEPRSDGRSLRRVLWLRTGPHPHGRWLSGVACVGGGVDTAQGTASHSVHTLSDMDRQRLRLPERRGDGADAGIRAAVVPCLSGACRARYVPWRAPARLVPRPPATDHLLPLYSRLPYPLRPLSCLPTSHVQGTSRAPPALPPLTSAQSQFLREYKLVVVGGGGTSHALYLAALS